MKLIKDDYDMLRVVRETQPISLKECEPFVKYIQGGLVGNIKGGLGLTEKGERELGDYSTIKKEK